MKIAIGTEVTCIVRGKRVTAVVAGEHTVERKGRIRELARAVTGDPHSLDRDCVMLVSMTDVAWYRTGEGVLKPTGNKVEPRVARERLETVKAMIKGSRYQRAAKNWNAAAETLDVYSLNNGDEIEVKFSDIGWQRVAFAGVVTGSGNIRFAWRGRTKSINPQFCRRVAK